MDKKTECDYLKNELKNINNIQKLIVQNQLSFENRIDYLNKKILEIDMILEAGNIRAVDYNQPQAVSGMKGTDNYILSLIIKQDGFKKEAKRLIEDKENDVYGLNRRMQYITDCLLVLPFQWQRDFLVDYYSKGINTVDLSEKYMYSDRTLRRFKDDFISFIINNKDF